MNLLCQLQETALPRYQRDILRGQAFKSQTHCPRVLYADCPALWLSVSSLLLWPPAHNLPNYRQNSSVLVSVFGYLEPAMPVPSLLMSTKSGPFCGVDSSWQLLASCGRTLPRPGLYTRVPVAASVPDRRVSFPSLASCHFISPLFPALSFRGGSQHSHDSVLSSATIYCAQPVDGQRLEYFIVVKCLHNSKSETPHLHREQRLPHGIKRRSALSSAVKTRILTASTVSQQNKLSRGSDTTAQVTNHNGRLPGKRS